MRVNYQDKVIMRRDGTVAVVTDVSGGWLLLDGDVNDSALPAEVQVIDLDEADYFITKSALAFGIDPLQAKRIPDEARKKVAQRCHRYCALQIIVHPTIEKAYLTIKGISEYGRYLVTVKPEKGNGYELLLSEKSIELFEREGVLPMKGEVNHKEGDVVSFGERVVILKEKLENDWSYIDPMTGEVGKVADSANLVAQPKIISDAMNHLYEQTQANQATAVKQGIVDSLRSENSALHKQLDAANNLLRANEATAEKEATIQKQLDDAQNELSELKTRFSAVQEQAAQENLELMRLKKEAKHASANPAPVSSGQKEFECKILIKTGEADFERLWSDGWTCCQTQFMQDGTVSSIWKKFNLIDLEKGLMAASDAIDTDGTLEKFDKVLYGTALANTTNDVVTMPVPVVPSENKLTFGKYGTALVEHGLEKTIEGMNAEVALAALKAAESIETRPITQFLPSGELVTS